VERIRQPPPGSDTSAAGLDLAGVTKPQLAHIASDINHDGDLIHVAHGSKPMCMVEAAPVVEALATLGASHRMREPFQFLRCGPYGFVINKARLDETVRQHQDVLEAAMSKFWTAKPQNAEALSNLLLDRVKRSAGIPMSVLGIMLGYGAENSIKFAARAPRDQMIKSPPPTGRSPCSPGFLAWDNAESRELRARYANDGARMADTVLKEAYAHPEQFDDLAPRVLLGALFAAR
jgi:hypothetical protein